MCFLFYFSVFEGVWWWWMISGGVWFWVLFLFSDFQLLRGLDDGRKDTYGVFAEPVDPEEVRQIFFQWVSNLVFRRHPWLRSSNSVDLQLPDYHDVIDHPMDFATVRQKLAAGSYTTLEQFEVCKHVSAAHDWRVLLFCIEFLIVWYWILMLIVCALLDILFVGVWTWHIYDAWTWDLRLNFRQNITCSVFSNSTMMTIINDV